MYSVKEKVKAKISFMLLSRRSLYLAVRRAKEWHGDKNGK